MSFSWRLLKSNKSKILIVKTRDLLLHQIEYIHNRSQTILYSSFQKTMTCNSSIFKSLLVPTCQLSQKIIYGSKTNESLCQWTCDDLLSYCDRQRSFDNFIDTLYPIVHDLQYKLYHIGIICNLFLFLTLLSPTLSGSTFLFLRTIAFVQLCLGVLYYSHPGADPDKSRPSFYDIVWPKIMKAIVVSGKFMLNTLSLFLMMDRFLAVWFLNLSSRIKKWNYFFIFNYINYNQLDRIITNHKL